MNKIRDLCVKSMKQIFNLFNFPLRLTLLYAFFGVIWMSVSDQLLEQTINNPNLLITLGTFKDWFFIVITAILLFVFVSMGVRSDKKQFDLIIDQSEQTLKNSLKELADVYKALDESSIIAITDEKGTIKYVNDNFCEISKYSREELLEQDHRMLNSGYHDKDFFREMWNTIKNGESWEGEFRNRAKDGSYYWVYSTIVPFLNDNGKPYQYVSIRYDITGKKLTEVALKESKERYKSLFEHNSNLIYSMDLNGNFMEGNSMFEQVTGYSNSEFSGFSFESIVNPDCKELMYEKMNKVIQGEAQRYECTIFHKKGYMIPLLVTNVPIIVDDEVIGIYGAAVDLTDLKRAELALKESEERYRQLVEISPEAIIVYVDGNIKYVNPSGVRLLGASYQDELLGKPLIDFAQPQYIKLVQAQLDNFKMTGMPITPVEEKMMRLDGKIIDVELKGITINFEDNPAILVMVNDITRRKKAEVALRESEEHYRLLADNMTDLVKILDINGIVIYASPSHETVLGFSPNDIEGNSAFELIHPDDINHLQGQFEQGVKTMENYIIEFRCKSAKGQWVWLEAKGCPVEDDEGNFLFVQIVARDITERKMFEEKLNRLAYYDILTGIPNRRLFQDRLEQTIKESERYKRQFALMYMDMDKFKQINDTLGHDVGDELLKQFTKRVQNCLRESDTFARLGGDEFIVLLPEINGENDAIVIADQILKSLQIPWKINNNKFKTTSSIGISFYPNDGTSKSELMKNADIALYDAKENGRNVFMTFRKE